MDCGSCGVEILPDSLFCTACGAKIEIQCSACPARNPPGARFCRKCGSKDASIDGLAEAIHERTGGNPLFTEEVVQSLIESGSLEGTRGSYRLVTPIARLQVPPTVHALLAARIDRLGEREKHVLQAAAVIGNDFPEPILAAACEVSLDGLRAALRILKNAEFIYEQSLYPVAEYAFKHPLTQEVALRSQLQERRRRTHAAVAGALEEANGERLDETAALLAHHHEEAGDAAAAARWHRRAAEWAGLNDMTTCVMPARP